VRERALAPRRRTALGALLRVLWRGSPLRAARNGSRNPGAAAACRGPGLRREAGPRRPDWTETVLSALRRPRLSRPRARAAAGKAAETEDFSQVPGAHHSRAAVNARRSPRRGDGTRAARSLRRRHRRRCVLESGGRTIWGPRAADPSPPPRPASGAPASAPLFPPGLEAPGSECRRESCLGRGALETPSGSERSPETSGGSARHRHPPRHGELSRGGTAAPSEVRVAGARRAGWLGVPSGPRASPVAARASLLQSPTPPPTPLPPRRPCPSSLGQCRCPRPLPARWARCCCPLPNFSANSRSGASEEAAALRVQTPTLLAQEKAAEAVCSLLGRRAGMGREMEGVCVCVCVCTSSIFWSSCGFTPFQPVALSSTPYIWDLFKCFPTSGQVWGPGWGVEEERKWRGRLACLGIGLKEVSSPNG
jgi:hypothetical protein